jgi:hypothetical protein
MDLPGRQAHPGQANERGQVLPADRLDREAGAPARAEPAEIIPEIGQLVRQRRRLKLGLETGALLRLVRPLDQALEDLPIGNTVLERRQIEALFSERPQLVAEG